MAYLIADKQFGRPVLADGVTPNPFWNDLVQAATRGLYVENQQGTLKLDGLTDYEELTIEKVAALASLGIETHEYPAFAMIPLGDLDSYVPEYLPGAHALDGNGAPTTSRFTWDEWRPGAPQNATHAIIGLVHQGIDCLGSVIAQLVAGGFTVLSLPQAQAIMNGE